MAFTSSNSGNQTVHVHAVDDDVDNPGGSHTARITHRAIDTSDSDPTGLNIEYIEVTILDDDPTTVTLAATTGFSWA